MIELKKTGKKYKIKRGEEKDVLKNINLKFEKSGMIFILGKSGSGKTTLLNIIGGLDKSSTGEMIIDGTSSKKFKENDFDNYRNKYIGFIFQDYNIIEDYKVIDNIKLPLSLQNKKIEAKKIENLLQDLGISELKNRKANEFSGGEKQRIAIARAIIKNPKIILADEPTGNLDSKNGKNVMELLKKISKDKLVIVVTHDEEFAKTYGDRIIQIKDGEILNDVSRIDNKDNIENKEEKYEVVKPKLPIKDAIKLGFISLKSKKLRLAFTILLITISTIFLSIAYMMKTYDIDENQLKIIEEQKVDQIEIRKYYYNKDIPSAEKQMKYLKSADINNISERINREIKPVYVLEHNSRLQYFLKLNVYVQEDLMYGQEEEARDLYTVFPSPLNIVEINENDNLIKEKIIGRMAKNVDEVIISNYLADLIIKYGIHEYESDEIYNPDSYEDIVNKNKKIYFGNSNYVKIVGIIKYDLSAYDKLKGEYVSKEQFKPNLINLNLELSKKSKTIYNKVYVKEGFIDNLKINDVIDLDPENRYVTYLGGKYISNVVNYPREEIEYYDGKSWIKTTSLNKDEMVLNLAYLIEDYYGYVDALNDYIKKYPKRDKLELEKEFIKSYMNLNEYIGKEVKLDIYEDVSPIFNIEGKKVTKEYSKIKVIGVTGLVNSVVPGNLYSKEILEEYKDSDLKINGVILREENIKKINELLKKFPNDGKYSVYTMYTNDTEDYKYIMNSFKSFIDITGIALLIFSSLLISNFMLISITSSKKEIGILKSLGARKIDIMKIFILEGIILTIITSILSAIATRYIFMLINQTIMKVSNLIISAFYINKELVIVIFIYIFIVIMISSIIPLLKITKMKPIDAIYNRK